jgi:hypothetical protein
VWTGRCMFGWCATRAGCGEGGLGSGGLRQLRSSGSLLKRDGRRDGRNVGQVEEGVVAHRERACTHAHLTVGAVADGLAGLRQVPAGWGRQGPGRSGKFAAARWRAAWRRARLLTESGAWGGLGQVWPKGGLGALMGRRAECDWAGGRREAVGSVWGSTKCVHGVARGNPRRRSTPS